MSSRSVPYRTGRNKAPPPVKISGSYPFFFSFLVECYLEGTNQDLSVAVIVAICRFCEDPRHFPEDAAKLRFGRWRLLVGTEFVLAFDPGLFILQGPCRKGRLVFRNARLDSEVHVGSDAFRYRHVRHGDAGSGLVHPGRYSLAYSFSNRIPRVRCVIDRVTRDGKILLLLRLALDGLSDGGPIGYLRRTFYQV